MKSQPAGALTASGTLPAGQKVCEQVARRIVRDVITNQVEPGQTLPSEATMMSQYGVGRVSVREALRILEIHGFVTVKRGPGGGPIVATVDPRNFGRMSTLYFQMVGATFDEVLQASVLIESVLVGLAARNRDPQQLARLRDFLEYAKTIPVDNIEDNSRLAQAYHEILGEMGGNKVLDIVSRGVRSIYNPRREGEFNWIRMHDEHEAIAGAIFMGDSVKAELLMRAHLEHYTDYIRRRTPSVLFETVDWGLADQVDP